MSTSTGTRIGIAIGADRLHGVSTVNGRALLAFEAEFGSLAALNVAIRRCLAQMREESHRRGINVHVALEPSRAQVRRISGIPPLASREHRHALADLSRHEHFLGPRDSLSVFVGEQESDGSLWVMCAETSLIRCIAAAVLESKLRLLRVVPVMDLLAAAGELTSTVLTRRDGDFAIGHAQVEAGRLTKAWRTHRASDACVPRETARFPVHGSDGLVAPATSAHFDAAHAVLASIPRSRFADPTMLSVPVAPPLPSRLRVRLSLAVVLTAVAVLVSPLKKRWDADRAAFAIEQEQPTFRLAAAQRRELDSLQVLVSAVRRFRADNAPALSVMAALGRALTDESFVTSLTVDSLSVQATLLAPSATEVVERLGAASGIDSVSLTGAITRERIAAAVPSSAYNAIGPIPVAGPPRELERVAVRFVSARATGAERLRDSLVSGRRTGAIVRAAGRP